MSEPSIPILPGIPGIPIPVPPPDYTPVPKSVTPHSGGKSFTMEQKAVLSAARDWEDISDALSKAAKMCEVGWGYPGLFGANDALQTTGKLHQEFNKSVVYACNDGAVVTKDLANGLVSAVNVAVGTDHNAADNFDNLKKRLG